MTRFLRAVSSSSLRRLFTLAVIFGFAYGVSAGEEPEPVPIPDRLEEAVAKSFLLKPTTDELVKLKQERLVVARERVKLLEPRLLQDIAIEEFHRATLQMLEAELDLCENNEERLSVLKNVVERYRAVEAIYDQMSREGGGLVTDTMLARYNRISAEIRLLSLQREVAASQAAVGPATPSVSLAPAACVAPVCYPAVRVRRRVERRCGF
jgi:hypothetical protein